MEIKNLEQLKGELFEMENRMRTMEWDYQHNQINPFKKLQFEVMLKEKNRIIEEINIQESVNQ